MVYNPKTTEQLDTERGLTQLRFQLGGLAGLAFSERFVLYGGFSAGYARTWNSDTLCGDHPMKNFVHGAALQPALDLGKPHEIELSLMAELGRTPRAYCTEITRTSVRFYENTDDVTIWTALRARYRF